MNAPRIKRRAMTPGCSFLLVLSMLFAPDSAHASCGSAYCSLNSDWPTQGAWTEPGWRGDLRYEFINQDQPRGGSERVAVGQIPRHHDEVSTLNRNLLASLSYAWSSGTGLSLTLPVIERDHHHVHKHQGGRIDERWNFRKPGDARAVVHIALNDEAGDSNRSYGLLFGLKLPTGRHDVANTDGEVAERTLQPGTGSTDAVAGVYWRQDLPGTAASLFSQLTVQAPFNSSNDYRPARTLALDAGFRYRLLEKIQLSAQLNYAAKGRDSGGEAEPADSGSRTLALSPGLSVSLSRDVQAYVYLQWPLYQNVNGVQLTASRSVVGGMSMRF